MQKSLYLSIALAAGLMFASAQQPAEAAPLAPPPPPGATHGALVNAAWSCGPRRCDWVPGFRGPVPGYAMRWGAPLYPNCYWKRGLLGKWKQKCRN